MSGPERLVVVGASLAGLRAVETARRLGFDGSITLIGDELHAPYDRPPLSKEYLDDGDAPTPHLSTAEALSGELEVELRLGAPATGLDTSSGAVHIGEERVPYDAALIATGVTARALPGTGHLAGVHALRTLEDARAVRDALTSGARTVIIGAGFIGSEIASAAHKRGLDPVVIEAAATPLARSVGVSAGARLAALHARAGTDLRCGVGVSRLAGTDRVEAVVLADGTELPADLVVVGVGADPAVGWLADSSLTLDNGIVCDETLQAAPGVWAAGDVARWHSPDFDQLLRLEHWTNAAEQAAHAVANLLDPESARPYHHIPYFWSDWYGDRIQFAGLAVGEPVLVSGDWDGDSFVALFRDGDRLSGVLTLNRRGDIMKYRAQIARGADWEAALEFAAQRDAAAAARRAAQPA